MHWWQIRKRNADLEQELASDLALEEEEQREQGVPPEDAPYAARRAFGNTTLIREKTHEAWGWSGFERLGQDMHYAFRQFAEGAGIQHRRDDDPGAGHRRHHRNLHAGI